MDRKFLCPHCGRVVDEEDLELFDIDDEQAPLAVGRFRYAVSVRFVRYSADLAERISEDHASWDEDNPIGSSSKTDAFERAFRLIKREYTGEVIVVQAWQANRLAEEAA